MTQKTAKDLLEGAYALANPDDNVAYYSDFAAIYDDSFATEMGYQSPRLIAAYLSEVIGTQAKIADIGCGTGLVADHLAGHIIDGYDISPEMIDAACTKNTYRRFYRADLTRDLSDLPNDYDALVSAGTFTMGHLNADDLIGLLDLLRQGAWVAITISKTHFDNADFGTRLEQTVDAKLISEPEYRPFSIYNKSGHDHSADQGWLTRFQKA